MAISGDDLFVGRGDELAAIARAAARAREGAASIVFVAGEAGSGKSTLVRRAVATLTDFTAITAQADELATHLAFDVVAQIQPPSATAPFAVGLDLLERLSALQDSGPVLLVVEDLHWADNESRLSLLTALRRLGHDMVLAVVTSRPDSRDAADGWDRFRFDPQCVSIDLGAFSIEEVARLADAAGVSLRARDAERLQRHTAGLPLYVRTLLRELTPEQLTTDHGPLPAPRSLSSATLARLAEVSAPARDLVAALAVLNQRVPLALLGQVGGVDAPTDALEELLATGIVVWSPGEAGSPVAFAHPLYRSAVYDDLAPSLRRRLHLAAAEHVAPDLALAHRLAAADRPDAALADALESAGAAARASGQWSSSAHSFLAAAQVSPDPATEERRLLAGAKDLVQAGQMSEAAAALAPRLVACGPSPERDLVLGQIAWHRGDAERAAQLLLAAADAEDPEIATDALLELATHRTTQSLADEALEAATRAFELAPVGSERATRAWALRAVAIGQMSGAARGLEAIAQQPSATAPSASENAAQLMTTGMLSFYAGRIDPAAADYRRAIDVGRSGGAANLVRAHTQLATCLFMLGDWDLALVNAHAALALISEEPQIWNEAQAQSAATMVPAARGDWASASATLQAAQGAAAVAGVSEAHFTACIAAAQLYRARGEPGLVVEALTPLLSDDEGRALPMFTSLSWWHTLIVALIECGNLDRAANQIEHLASGAEARGIDMSARIADLRGRLSAARNEPAAAAAAFQDAVERLGPNDPLIERAELHHAFGRLLRSTGDRQGATSQLRTARTLLDAVGAVPYVARVDASLDEIGITSSAEQRSPLDLTEREQDVVALVAKGLTNREVAAELYVSQKAVEYHLRNVFGKLGVTSRRQLRDRAADEPSASRQSRPRT